MWLGIDVGGTFTDAVVICDGRVERKAKRATTGHLLEGILEVLDAVLEGLDPASLERITLSTTVVTNALVQGRTDPVELLLMAGPGMPLDGLVPGPWHALDGYIDHRGREVRPNTPGLLAQVIGDVAEGAHVAVSGKFAVRNPTHESQVADALRKQRSPRHISLGSQMAGALDFVRRTNSAWYNASVWRQFSAFADAMEEGMRRRGLSAPLHILKADGGTLPLAQARLHPVEAIFTGPAASVLGVVALGAPAGEAVSLDIGGTTTDIALWRQGSPLFAARGARVDGHVTAVRAFALHSVGLGGDSLVQRGGDGGLVIGPTRAGPAMALGGSRPTVTDALVVAGRTRLGDPVRALDAMRTVARPGQDAAEVAQEILDTAASRLEREVQTMIEERASEPVYRVDDIVHGERLHPGELVGVGGTAAGLAPLVAGRLGVPCRVPGHAMVANAIGAAVARPTVDVTLRADTVEGFYTVPELGIRRPLSRHRLQPEQAIHMARQHLHERAQRDGVADTEMEVVSEEAFHVVRGFQTLGNIVTCRVQVRPGVLTAVAAPSTSDEEMPA